MMKKFLLVWLFVPAVVAATDLPQSFRNLKTVKNDITVAYNPGLTTVVKKNIDPNSGEQKDMLLTRISAKSSIRYLIAMDPGMSDDPEMVIKVNRDGKWQVLTSIPGETFYIPGNGNIYVVNRMNTNFTEHRKYRLANGAIKEIKQPYLYVGLKTHVNRATITIYADKAGKLAVATLPRGTKVEVLVNEGDHYLLRTPFGLTGWYYMKEHATIVNIKKSPLPGIYTSGD